MRAETGLWVGPHRQRLGFEAVADVVEREPRRCPPGVRRFRARTVKVKTLRTAAARRSRRFADGPARAATAGGRYMNASIQMTPRATQCSPRLRPGRVLAAGFSHRTCFLASAPASTTARGGLELDVDRVDRVVGEQLLVGAGADGVAKRDTAGGRQIGLLRKSAALEDSLAIAASSTPSARRIRGSRPCARCSRAPARRSRPQPLSSPRERGTRRRRR